MEPYRIKIVEQQSSIPERRRNNALAKAYYNPFLIPADCVMIDLISDSGTGAMSSRQWAAMIEAHEDFSGQKAHRKFVRTAQRAFGLPFIQPVHQGRPAENLLFQMMLTPGDIVVSNTHFETTRDNIEALGCRAFDIPDCTPPFCGNIDIKALERYLRRGTKPRVVILTLTNNINGGQPISTENIEAVHTLTEKHKISLVFDASRFAGNAFLCKEYTKSRMSIAAIIRRQFSLCDIAYMSCKKDGLVNIGGFIAMRDKRLFERLAFHIIKQESYPSAGGLAARDLAAMEVGLQEAIDEDFLRSHISTLRYLAQLLKQHGVSFFEPVGGHGIAITPKYKSHSAAFALAAEVYLASGIRGGVFDGKYRLALPRRVYTCDHMRYVADVIGHVYHTRAMKLRLINRPRAFFNFFAKFKKIN